KRNGKDMRQGAVVAGKNGNGAVSVVRFVNSANQNDADNIVAAIGDNGMVIFSGAVNAQNATTIEIMHNGVAIVGGGQALQLRGAQDGRVYGFNTPGTRATVTQADNMTDIFHATGRQNLFFGGFDMQGGNNGIHVEASPNVHLSDIRGINNGFNAVRIDGSINARLENIFADNAGNDGIHIRNGSHGSLIIDSRSFSAGQDGLAISSSNRVRVTNFTSTASAGDGVDLNNSQDAVLKNVTVTGAAGNGILLGMGTARTMIDHANISGVTSGILINQAADTTINNATITAANFGIDITNSTGETKISNTRLNVAAAMAGRAGLRIEATNNVILDTVTITGSNGAGSTGIILTNGGNTSDSIQFKNVLVQNYDFGYAFDTNSAVKDNGGNQAANITNVADTCDGTNDVDEGQVSVLNTTDNSTRICN
ncbi:MAG TPA: right-handed parallel beta-helix repeat-containing protein, partial [Alphaproteobacteria bacterium]|nr:right-handed parallel beta-helix repeat-containing protein [Alphaproteobacteria bacterium]